VRLCVIDLETTGVTAATDRIVEIAIVRTEDGVQTDAWSSLVRPDVPVGASERVHHISDAMLAGAPTLGALRGEIADRLAGATMVAHRAAFDLGFLDAAAARAELAPVPRDVIDTAAIGDRVLGESGLAAIARRIGGRAPTHRALPDALAALDALEACIETLGPIDAVELVALSRPRASMRAAVETALRAGEVTIVYRPASGRAHEDVLRVESLAPPYVTGVLEKKNVRRMLRGDRIVRAWVGERPRLRFF
jgi:DNA polymerase III epsilon subunit-like protein